MSRLARRTFLAIVFLLTLTIGCISPGVRAQEPPRLDLARLSDDATAWLTGLLRIDTTNPPGNELAAARYLADILQKEGIPSEVIESAPGRGLVIAPPRSGPIADPSRALLLLGHTDVVGVQREKWSVDPFGGVPRDGYLWGRGTLDCKGMVVANLAVMVGLKGSGVPLTGGGIFLA